MKEVLRCALSRAIVSSGSSAVIRAMFPKSGSLILYGHRVENDDEGYLQGLSPSWFAEQIEYLTRHFEIIPLSYFVSCFESGRDAPSNSVVLTFDDGFRDNYENAFPVLERHAVPATIFVVTDCLSSGQLPWPQRLGYLFQLASNKCFRHDLVGGVEHDLTGPGRRETYLIVKRVLGTMDHRGRERSIEELSEVLDVEPPRDRMLTWAQAREMKAKGIEFGAHTFSHPLLANVPREEARWEMEKSLGDLQEHMGIERPSFCFPGGSYDAALVEMVKALGFRSVFQSSPRLRVNSPATTDQFALSRVGLPNAPSYILEAELDGPFHAVRRLYRR